MDIQFVDKVVVVTGASAGIGKEITKKFLENGAKVFMVSSNENHLNATLQELKKEYPEKVAGMVGDLSDAVNVAPKIVDAVRGIWKTIDILVNNAGIYPSKYALEMQEKDWDRIFDLNVKGYFFMAQSVAKAMVEEGKKGHIINITSGAAANVRPGAIAYATSKAATVMLTKGLALEWIRKGIHVNAVGPGLIETEALLASLSTDEAQAEHKEKISMIPIARTGLSSEIADAVMFLASDKAEFIVGQNLFVDGGYTCGRVFQSKMK